MQDLKKEVKILEGLNEELDFIQRTWQSKGQSEALQERRYHRLSALLIGMFSFFHSGAERQTGPESGSDSGGTGMSEEGAGNRRKKAGLNAFMSICVPAAF